MLGADLKSCHLVQVIQDASVPVARKGTPESKTFLSDEEYLKSLTQLCTGSLSTSTVCNCKLYVAPSPSNRGWPGLCATSADS